MNNECWGEKKMKMTYLEYTIIGDYNFNKDVKEREKKHGKEAYLEKPNRPKWFYGEKE